MKAAIVMGVDFYAPGTKDYDKWIIGENDFTEYMARTGDYRNNAKKKEDKIRLESLEHSSDFSDYMARTGKFNKEGEKDEVEDISQLLATREQAYNYYNYIDKTFIDFKKVQNQSSGLFDAREDILTYSEIAAYRDVEKKFKDHGGVKYPIFLSFDNQFLKLNNIITNDNMLNVKELKNLTRSAVSTLINKSERLDPSSLIWTGAIHMDKLHHMHIHISIIKDGLNNQYAGRDMLELSAINATKSKVVNRFIGHEDVKLLTKIERQELLPQLKDIISSDTEELIKLAKVLPPDRQWQYNRPKMKPFRKQIDDFTDRLIRNDPSLRDKYADYINLVDQRATKLKALYGEGEKKFYKNEKINRLAEFHARAGNAILQEINEIYPAVRSRAHLSEKERIDIATNDFSSSERYDEIDMTDNELSDIEAADADFGDRAHLTEKEQAEDVTFSDITAVDLSALSIDTVSTNRENRTKAMTFEEYCAHLTEKEQFDDPSYIAAKSELILNTAIKLRISWNRAYTEACSLIYNNEPGSNEHLLAEKMLLSEGAKGNIIAISQLGTYYKDLDPELSHRFYAKALDSFLAIEPTSKKQRAYVQYRIGKAYCYGLGTEQDYSIAADWFEKSAAANNRFAQYSLGSLYYNGNGVIQDYSKALACFLASANHKQPQPYAAYMLGQMYAKGEGTQIDTETSNHYYSIAISGFEKLVKDERADDNTYYKLARMYSKGLGTQINMDKAVKYWKKACEAGNVNALYDYAKALMYGEGIEKDCEKAVELLKQAISKGSINAKRLLANEYLTGEHLIQDAAHGIDLLKECAAEGDASSNYKLGKIFNEGLFGAEEDPAEAQKYFNCAFREYKKLEEENELTEGAAFILGNMCEKGLGTEINIDAAIRYYSFSADNGNEFAQYAIGKIYLTEDHFDTDQAEHYLLLASEQGNINAKRILANEYLTGEHLNQDAAHGIDLLKECAAEGDASSNYKLGKIFNEGLFGAGEDPAEAQKYFSRAFREYSKLEKDNKLTEGTAFILAGMYEKGLGTEINIDAAIKNYSFSADNGNEFAQYAVGRLYLTDDHFNSELAEKYLKLSAEQGNSYGQLGLGILYNRLGNKKLSDYWIRQAADNGNEFAQKIIDSRLHPVEHSNQNQSAKSNLTGATFSALKQIYNKLNAQVNKLLAEAERDEMIDNQRFRKY
ncbi:MAG: SEL1-like repeat protein [Ruminococcus sp.]|nr:SEL1-like repeat protein [Ruminococcus sp.]